MNFKEDREDTHAAARAAEDRRRHRYAAISHRYDFVPLAMEITSVPGAPPSDRPAGRHRQQNHREDGETREKAWLRQHDDLVGVRGNDAGLCQLLVLT